MNIIMKKGNKNMKYDCIIIGSGVAGMTAALYLKRANKNILIIESNVPGGQINRTAIIENYPGYAKIDGPTLAMNIFEQMNQLGIPYQFGEVLEIKSTEQEKIVKTKKDEYQCDGIIIATGRVPKELGLENETNLVGHGISWCALCDGTFYKDQDVCVVGGGNSALEEALYLSSICRSITIIHRRDQFRADKILIDRVKNTSNIRLKYNSVVKTINETKGFLSSIEIENETNCETLECTGLFIYIGSKPTTEFIKNINIELDQGYIVVDQSMRTNQKGIYACGDVIKKEVYQITTATAEGAIAAMSFIKDHE